MSTRVLLVEDNRLDIMAFERMVKSEKLPYDYTIAQTVAEALAYLDEPSPFDIILTDYNLPDGTGLAILEAVAETPVIFMTAYGDEEIAVKAIKSGAAEYVIKDGNYTYITLLPITIEHVIEQDRIAKRLRAIEFERNLAATLYCNASGQIIDCNDTLVLLSGYQSKNQLLNLSWPDLIEEDFTKLSYDLATKEVLLGHNLTLRHVDGNKRYAVANLALVPGRERAAASIRVILIDITAQKVAEQELHLLKQAFDSSTVGITLADAKLPDLPLIYANPAYKGLVGASKEDSLGQKGAFLQGIEPEQPGLTLLREAIRKGTNASVVILNYRKDGIFSWNHLSISPLYDQKGEITHFVGIHKDITQQKRIEQALSRSEKRYRQMFEMHGLPKLIVDPTDGTIVDANPAAARFYGHDVETLKTLNIFHLNITPADEVAQKMIEASHSEMLSCEFVHRGAGGQSRDVEVFTGPVENDGKQLLYSVITDITEKNQAKAALQETLDLLENRVTERTAELLQANNRLEAIFNHSGDCILLLHIEEGIQQANYAFDLLFDTQATNYYGKELTRFFRPVDTSRIEATLRQVALAHQIEQVQTQVDLPDGRTIDLEMNIAPVNRSEQEVMNLVCIFRDITERKRAGLLIAEERNLLRTLIDTTPDFIYIKDAQHRYILSNKALAKARNYDSSAELIGKSDLDFFPPELVEQIHAEEAAILQTGKPLLGHELSIKGLHDEPIWVASNKVPLRTLNGDIIGVVGISHDISQLKASEQALRESEWRYRALFEQSNDAVFILDTTGKHIIINPQAAEMLGYTEVELAGLSSLEIVVSDEYDKSEGMMQRLLDGEQLPIYERTFRRKDGSRLPVEINVSLVRDEYGNPLHIQSIARDISVRKQIEESLKQALAQEKELGELKSSFVSMASHEFRTPLATILATVDTLDAYRHRLDDADITRRLGKIRDQGRHLKLIMDDMLELGRMQARRVAFEPVETSVTQLCSDMIDEFSTRPDIKNPITFTAYPNTIIAQIDSKLLRQIISNLLSNAFKYSLNSSPVSLHLSLEDKTLTFTVQDQGIGIPHDDQKHLFEAFHRAKNVGSISGTGLGLSITKQAVELHNGTIQFESAIGVGTTFVVNLPITVE